MKIIIKAIRLISFLFVGIAISFLTGCENDLKFEDHVPDYTHSIIRSFEVNGQAATIDHTNGVINLTLPAGSDISKVPVTLTKPEGATVAPDSGSIVDFSNGAVIFTITNKGVTREYTVTVAVYGNPMIMSFSIGANLGTIDHAAGIISITVGSQENITRLVPQYVVPGGTTATPQSGIAQNFSNPVKFTVVSDDGFTGKSYFVHVIQIAAPIILSFNVDGNVGAINNIDHTITVLVPPTYNLSSITPTLILAEGQTVSPATQVAQNFSNGAVAYTVTNTEGLSQVYQVSVISSKTGIAFIGDGNDINSIQDDDAKAAALFLKETYPNDFNYIKFSDITAASLENIKVIMLYYLSPLPNLGYAATASNALTMLPAELRPGTSQSNVLKSWVKAGGDMFIAGDPTPFVNVLGRVPADYSKAKAIGNYVYTEFGCGAAGGCVDYGKPADDIWGLGVRDANNSGNRRSHPIYSGLNFVGDGELPLSNSATREARLVWWNSMEGLIGGSTCCGQSETELIEQTLHSVKLGTLRWVGDGFGIGAMEYLGTDKNRDANYDSNIPTDFKGHIITMENTIIGYEFNPNGTVNNYQNNIEKLTKNIIGYLRTINND